MRGRPRKHPVGATKIPVTPAKLPYFIITWCVGQQSLSSIHNSKDQAVDFVNKHLLNANNVKQDTIRLFESKAIGQVTTTFVAN